MPGVQKPHCRPCWSQNACWIGCSSAPFASPSTVSSSAPSACTANIRQERTVRPFIKIVQAPQTPCSQPTCVPVRRRSSRMKSTSSLRGSQLPRSPCRSPSGGRSPSRPSLAPLPHAAGGLFERPPDEYAHHLAAVVGRAVDVAFGIGFVGGGIGGCRERLRAQRLADQRRLGALAAERRRPTAGDGHARR